MPVLFLSTLPLLSRHKRPASHRRVNKSAGCRETVAALVMCQGLTLQDLAASSATASPSNDSLQALSAAGTSSCNEPTGSWKKS